MLSLSKHLYRSYEAVEMLRQAQHDVLLNLCNCFNFLNRFKSWVTEKLFRKLSKPN